MCRHWDQGELKRGVASLRRNYGMARGDWGWGFPRAFIWSMTSDEDGFGEKTVFLLNRVQFKL